MNHVLKAQHTDNRGGKKNTSISLGESNWLPTRFELRVGICQFDKRKKAFQVIEHSTPKCEGRAESGTAITRVQFETGNERGAILLYTILKCAVFCAVPGTEKKLILFNYLIQNWTGGHADQAQLNRS